MLCWPYTPPGDDRLSNPIGAREGNFMPETAKANVQFLDDSNGVLIRSITRDC